MTTVIIKAAYHDEEVGSELSFHVNNANDLYIQIARDDQQHEIPSYICMDEVSLEHMINSLSQLLETMKNNKE